MSSSLNLRGLAIRFATVGFAIMAAGVSVVAAQYEAEFSPDPRQEFKGIHVCKWPKFVTGIHAKDNVFRCADKIKIKSPAAELIDGADGNRTVCEYPDENGKPVKLHCCPPDMAVRGIHVGKNLLVCENFDRQAAEALAGKRGLTVKIDHRTAWVQGEINMHVCPDSMPMLGYHEGRNLLLCLALGTE